MSSARNRFKTQRAAKPILAKPWPEMDELQEFYELGRQSLTSHQHPLTGPEKAAMRSRGESVNRLHKARAFATSYTPSDFDALVRKCRESQYALTSTTMVHLLAVSTKEARQQILILAIRSKWTASRMRQELLGRFGKKRIGSGRTVRPPRNERELLYRIRDFAEQWRRLSKTMQGAAGGVLSSAISERLSSVDSAINRLLDTAGTDVRGDVRCPKSGKPFIQFRPDQPGAPTGRVLVQVNRAQHHADFDKNRLRRLLKNGSKQDQLPKILRKWFGDDLAKRQVRFYRNDQGWVMEPLKMNPYLRAQPTPKTALRTGTSGKKPAAL